MRQLSAAHPGCVNLADGGGAARGRRRQGRGVRPLRGQRPPAAVGGLRWKNSRPITGRRWPARSTTRASGRPTPKWDPTCGCAVRPVASAGPGIATTYIRQGYGDGFSGTSAAAPHGVGGGGAGTGRQSGVDVAGCEADLGGDGPQERSLGRRVAAGGPPTRRHRDQAALRLQPPVRLRRGGRGGGGAAGRVHGRTFLPFSPPDAASSSGAASVPDNGSVVSQSVEVDTRDRLRGVGGGGGFVCGAGVPASGGGVGVAVGCGVVAVATRRRPPLRVGVWLDGAVSGSVLPGIWGRTRRERGRFGCGTGSSGGAVSRLDGWSLTVYGHRVGTGQACDGRCGRRVMVR